MKINNKTQIVRQLLKDSTLLISDVAAALDYGVQSVRNKFNRNSWSIDDLVTIAGINKMRLAFVDDELNIRIIVDPKVYFKDCQEAIDRIEDYKDNARNKKLKKYMELKAELEKLEREIDNGN